ncbi:MAG: tRNA (N(6)-L-threonylcarbamoyladenosine(37)-C(2))-methylthiotransferase MtaB [Tannerella sp.]|jgi:threonylcarbamoyladenosine tRNA methylthiotransferase MtaB|nr:tRNA (N(6)-L-threonylcarbamoyladenosine(37)-C(2))-methylthiotransferase MtaB [Tannerella sp.]
MTDSGIFENRVAAYYTLGCKLNFAETSTIGKELARRGFRKAGAGEQADICVINTCSVTELADRKCRQLIRRIHKLHPKAFVVATGCYAQLSPDAVSRIEGVNLVLGNAQKANIAHYIDRMTDTAPAVVTSPAKEMQAFAPSCSADDRTRHFLKVQDGCDYFCSYCTIPFARGRSRNGSIAEVVAQAAQVAGDGGKEIVLTGVNIGDFGKSTGETFIDLLRALDSVEGIARYRISSVEPNLITDEIIDFAAKSKRFAPHFHIPLQSGCDETLQLMRRRYDTELFRHRVEKIKATIPDAFIGVDIIVGARGETESRFEESYAFVEQLPVSQLHVFHYSERPGTQALQIEPVVAPAVKQLRSRRLMELSHLKWRQFYETQIGQTAETLFEHTRRGGMMHGFTANYVRTEAPYRTDAVNRITRVRLNGWNGDGTALACTFID